MNNKQALLFLLILLCVFPDPAFGGSAPPLKVLFLAGGDLFLGPHLAPYVATQGYDYPFLGLQRILQEAQVVFANLEAPLTERREVFLEKGYSFRSRPAWAAALARNGVNLLSLANNHILDYGLAGLRDTMRLLRREGIFFSGAGEDVQQARRAAWLQVRGIKIACLSYSLTFPTEFYATAQKPGTAFAYASFLEEDIPAASARADIVIVSCHWSEELLRRPKQYQRELAHKLIDLGADMVLGHHPHVVQGIEIYRGKPIAYSLGNLIFSSYSKTVKTGILLRCSLESGHRVRKLEVLPLAVDNRGVRFQPRLLSGVAAREAICELDRLSQPLGTEIMLDGDRGLLQLPGPK